MQSEMPTSADARFRPGVGIMLLNASGDVLVGRRNDVPDEEWQMPQGGIGDGEDPRAAAFRELKEEIGTDNAEVVGESRGWLRYDLPEALIGKAWGGRWRGQRQKWFVMRFNGCDADIDVDTAHPEFRAWKWVPVDHLPGMVVSFKRQVYLSLLDEFHHVSDKRESPLMDLLADPVVRKTMDADGIAEDELYEMLLGIAEHLRKKRHVTAVFPSPFDLDAD